MQQHQVDPVFVAKNNLDLASTTGNDGTNPDFTLSISSLFPANNSDTDETDSTSDLNETSPRFFHCSNSIVSFFPPFRSPTDSPENYEIIIPNPNPTITIPSSFSHFFPVPTNGPTSLSIPFIFPPTMSETETDDSCSESNDTAGAEFSYSIVSLFPPARSRSDSSSSENYEIIPTDPSISASPRRTIQKANFKDLIKFVKPKINRNIISKSNKTPPKKNSILSFFSTAKSLANSSKRPGETIQTTRFKDQRPEFLLQSLLKATNNFSEDHKIGPDRFGSIYRATFQDGQEVAIKSDNCALPSQSVLEALTPLNHKNVVCFLGFCKYYNKHVWVYEYMENGSLHDHLHKLQSTPVLWPARIKMALDVAEGIEYLHVQAVPPIIHRNIKSSNILLDVMRIAKVSDFSLSVEAPKDDESHHLSDLVGTLGYVDPDYLMHQELTTKIDVYSFGVVLLEILTGYEAFHTNENGVQQHIVDFVVPYIAQDEIHRILDPKVIPPTSMEMEVLAYVGSLAMDCASPDRQNRPSMTEVVKSLQRAMAACGS